MVKKREYSLELPIAEPKSVLIAKSIIFTRESRGCYKSFGKADLRVLTAKL